MTTTWALIADKNHASIFKTKGRMKGLELVDRFTHTAGHIEEGSASHAPEPLSSPAHSWAARSKGRFGKSAPKVSSSSASTWPAVSPMPPIWLSPIPSRPAS